MAALESEGEGKKWGEGREKEGQY